VTRGLPALVLSLAVACTGEELPSAPATGAAGAVTAWFVTEEPPGAEGVLAVKSGHADGDAVVVTGRVSEFVPGLATFTLVDPSLTPCREDGMDCETPWDYCCIDVTERNRATANVELRKDGRVLQEDIQGTGGLDHLEDVVVAGTASLDDQGNLTVVAERIYVRS
jgi:hypothetical protein